MIVGNTGYLKLESVLAIEHFSIYETRKNTHILVKKTSDQSISLYFPKKDKMPWKLVEGKKICTAIKVFDSKTDPSSAIDTSKWNNGNQIMSYEEYK